MTYHSQKWTTEERKSSKMARLAHLDEMDIARYYELKRIKLPDKEIAEKHFNVSYSAFNRWKKKYNIDPRRTAEEYLHLRNMGYRDNEIQTIWDMTPSGLFMWKRRNGIPEQYFTHMNKKGRIRIV